MRSLIFLKLIKQEIYCILMFLVLLFSYLMLLNFGENSFFKEFFLSLNVYGILNQFGVTFWSLAVITFLHMTKWTHFPIQLSNENTNLIAKFFIFKPI